MYKRNFSKTVRKKFQLFLSELYYGNITELW